MMTDIARPAVLRARDDRGADHSRTSRGGQPEQNPVLDDDGGWLCCAGCGARVTSRAAGREQAGRHEHVCANPEGLLFRIGCFDQAPGCITFGRPTSRWTWFPGFRWQVALCARCGAHLGWRFRDGGGSGFFGLIVDRMVDCGRRLEH